MELFSKRDCVYCVAHVEVSVAKVSYLYPTKGYTTTLADRFLFLFTDGIKIKERLVYCVVCSARAKTSQLTPCKGYITTLDLRFLSFLHPEIISKRD
jgi:hypothetical protein